VVTFFYFFLSLLLPAIWIYYFNKKDQNREPWKWLIVAFILGIYSALISYQLQNLSFNFVEPKSTLGIFLSAFIEEFSKFLLISLFIYPVRVVDEPIDAMIYLMFAALGFAFIENVAISASLLNKFGFNYEINILLVLFLRFLGANLLHILSSGLIGYGYAYFINTRNLLVFTISFISGTVLHFIYNYFIINTNYALVIPTLWLAFLVVLSELNYLAYNGRGKKGRNVDA